MLSSSEGFEYTPAGGLIAGLRTPAVISPPERNAITTELYDVIVIGAGWAGLTASRSLTVSGRKTLLIEARDRIGGRTWTSFLQGHAFEMGGTWIHWGQPHVWNEVTRYGLHNQIKDSLEYYKESLPPSTYRDGSRKDWDIQEMVRSPARLIENGSPSLTRILERLQAEWQQKAMNIYYSPDKKTAAEIIPYPYNPRYNRADFFKYDNMSSLDRLEQCKDQLTRDQYDYIVGGIMNMGGSDMNQISFFDLMHRWALSGGRDVGSFMDYHCKYKLECGQSGLARCLFDHAVKTGKLSYTFSTVVSSITHSNPSKVTVKCADGRTFSARKVICTLPATILREVNFVPELPVLKAEAIANVRGNSIRKLHIQAEGKQWRSWGATKFGDDGSAMMVMGESHSTSGDDSNVVCFSTGGATDLINQPSEQVAEVESLHPELKIKRMVFTEWVKDPYSKGVWCCHQPGYLSKYLAELQTSVGNLKFASADYCDGWRGYIDGAIESATLAAKEADDELRDGPRSPLKL